jgi:hypothetical protein
MSDRRPELLILRARSTTLPTLVLPPLPLNRRLWRAVKRTSARIAEYAAICREEMAAAALYQELRSLSDAELERRGVARGDLARHVRDAVGSMH